MTINSVRTLVTNRQFPSPPVDDSIQSSPRIYGAPDYPFKGWQPPQPEGYRQSAAAAHESALVIDNGRSSTVNTCTVLTAMLRLKYCQSWILLRQSPSLHGAPNHG